MQTSWFAQKIHNNKFICYNAIKLLPRCNTPCDAVGCLVDDHISVFNPQIFIDVFKIINTDTQNESFRKHLAYGI